MNISIDILAERLKKYHFVQYIVVKAQNLY